MYLFKSFKLDSRTNKGKARLFIRSTLSGKSFCTTLDKVLSTDIEYLQVFKTFVEMAIKGNRSYSDFCWRYKYVGDLAESYKYYKECVAIYNRFIKLNVNLPALLNDIKKQLNKLEGLDESVN